jgi:hypothetical protein
LQAKVARRNLSLPLAAVGAIDVVVSQYWADLAGAEAFVLVQHRKLPADSLVLSLKLLIGYPGDHSKACSSLPKQLISQVRLAS